MFKRIVLILALLVFAFGILFTSVWKTSAQSLQRAELTTSASEVVGEEATQAGEEKVEYNLTWPGILPDHFLYPVKMIRDRIWLWLTTDSLKKAELLLKFADKRIWAAQMLVDKGKTDLGVTTATKAEKYLERAINQAEVAKEKGKDTAAFLERLSRATLKHEEVLLEMREKVEEDSRPAINKCLDYARKLQEEVKKAIGEN